MRKLHTEFSIPVGKKPAQELTLIVDERDINQTIKGLQESYDYCSAHPDDDEALSQYTHSEAGDPKTVDEVITVMVKDISALTYYAEGLVKMSPMEAALAEIQKEIHGEKYKAVDWVKFFAKIPRKKDGTFAVGRVIGIYEAHGFSWEDMESYCRKGPEMIIKTMSATEARLMIRTGAIEKW